MKLLFIQGGSRVRESNTGTYYVDGNFNNAIWKRYKSYCSELKVILRKCSNKLKEEDLKNKYNKIDISLLNLELVDDIYSPKKNFLNLSKKKKIKEIIKKNVLESDKIIIRSIGNFYTKTALKYCKKYKKDYLIEVTGFAFEGLWYHSLIGKIFALPREIKLKQAIKQAPYAVYVTNEALQKRYPCKGKTIGCSDVEINNEEEEVLLNRLKKINQYSEKTTYTLGTAGFLNVKCKGQQDVLKAIYDLKRMGITNFKYELIGAGSPSRLEKIIRKYNLQDQVMILGAKTHEEVFNWLESIDIYIQPSYQEGLCRAIIEAMSMGCPVIASNVGGNEELIDKKYIFEKGKVKQLENILKNLKTNELITQSKNNFTKAKNYNSSILNEKRDKFYLDFITSGKETNRK